MGHVGHGGPCGNHLIAGREILKNFSEWVPGRNRAKTYGKGYDSS